MKVFSLDESLSSAPAAGADSAGVEALDVCVEAGADTAGDGPDDDEGISVTAALAVGRAAGGDAMAMDERESKARSGRR